MTHAFIFCNLLHRLHGSPRQVWYECTTQRVAKKVRRTRLYLPILRQVGVTSTAVHSPTGRVAVPTLVCVGSAMYREHEAIQGHGITTSCRGKEYGLEC
jgi:hypothetical protein